CRWRSRTYDEKRGPRNENSPSRRFRNKVVRRVRRFTNCKEERNGERYGLLYAFAPQEGPLAAFLVDGVLPLLLTCELEARGGPVSIVFFLFFGLCRFYLICWLPVPAFRWTVEYEHLLLRRPLAAWQPPMPSRKRPGAHTSQMRKPCASDATAS